MDYPSGDEPIDPHAGSYTGPPYTGPPPTGPPPFGAPSFGPPGAGPAPYGSPLGGSGDYGQPYAFPSSQPTDYLPPPGGYPAPFAPVYPPYVMAARPRPGAALSASVLGYIDGGLLILAGLVLFFGASEIQSFDDSFGTNNGSLTTELILDGLLNMVVAGVLIAGAVGLTQRTRSGRVLLTVGGGVCIAQAIYWLVRAQATEVTVWVIAFMALSAVMLVLAWTRGVSGWLSAPAFPAG